MSESHDPHPLSDPHTISEAHRQADAELEHHTEHPHVNYMMVFGALIAFTIISYLADVIGAKMGGEVGTGAKWTTIKWAVVFVVLVVASFKALAVMMYFMHLKFERLWKYALLAPTIILALALIVSLMPDIAGDYYERVIPQTKAAAEELHDAHKAGGQHGSGESGPVEGAASTPDGAPKPKGH